MPYKLIRGDENFPVGASRPAIFLGGHCGGRDWRGEMFQRFEQSEVTFVNPRRSFADPELDPARHAEQVAWDREAIEYADIVIFWLGEGLVNQAARVEIGFAIGKDKTVLIGADEKFLGLEHLTAFSGLVLSKSLEGLMNRLASLLTTRKG